MSGSVNTWAGDYLKDLRSNRPVRPTGARPFPTQNKSHTPKTSTYMPERAASALGIHEPLSIDNNQDILKRPASAMSHRRSILAQGPREMLGSSVVRPPIDDTRDTPDENQNTVTTTKTSRNSVSGISQSSNTKSDQPYKIPYYERGQRWMEKQEMSSLRRALEEKDLIEEQKIYDSAQDEAADLVWKQQNPSVPYPNPDRPNLRTHLKKGSHARTFSNTPFETLYVCKGGSDGHRSASDGSNGSCRTVSNSSQGSSGSKPRRLSSLSFSMRSNGVFGKSSSKRNRVSSKGSQKSNFPNPDDKIYEAVEDITHTIQDSDKPLPLRVKARNTSYGSKSIKDKISRIEEKSGHSTPAKNVSTVEIHKNSPSQSRNAQYRINKELPSSPEKSSKPTDAGPLKTDHGKEIRGEDIRAATSMSLKDRSSNLPIPTIVSDRPGRPIVSFKKEYKPRQKTLQHEWSDSTSSLSLDRDPAMTTYQSAPSTVIPLVNSSDQPRLQTYGVPVVPMISILEADDVFSIPSISLPDQDHSSTCSASIPIISFGEDNPLTPSILVSPVIPAIRVPAALSRPLPQPSKRPPQTTRPLSSQVASDIIRSAPHWSPAVPRGTAQCAACALPIAGKIVSASSKRFHPHCFVCFCCGELLECVAFYPEPEDSRADRLDRIQARLYGDPTLVEQSTSTEQDDGDDSLRFYCHLDYHEKFSPRCKSCKTPIEGQVIIACGAEWHVGHFFCAECGDPFAADMPFVEKDGFAWCVNCHTKRYAGKCAGCRKPITDLVVSALGEEWHGGCFRCKVSYDLIL